MGLAPRRGAPVGVILGSSFGSIDASAAFMHRLLAKGPRFASPAEFPNLVPSSPVGHVSIYLGLQGPVFAAAELGASGECAVMQAAELIASGEADAIAAGDIEEASDIVDRVLGALFARARGRSGARGAAKGGARSSSRRRTWCARAGMSRSRASRATRAGTAAMSCRICRRRETRARRSSSCRASRRRSTSLLAPTAWATVPRVARDARTPAGEHEALGATAIAVAASRIARGEASDALVVGLAKGRGYAVVLVAPVRRADAATSPRLARRLGAPPVRVRAPAISPIRAREWTRLREILAIARDGAPERPYVEQIVVAMREPRTGKVFQARGAVAVDPRHALRMILIGPGGVTALDAWITDEHFRFVVPPISLERRGGGDADSARGLPIGFFRWWLLHPLDGRLLAAWNRSEGPLYLLRQGDETVLLREARVPRSGRERVMAARREDGEVERLDWVGRSPATPHAGDKARYVDGVSGLEVEVLVEGLGDQEPDPAAFLDPDASPTRRREGTSL